MLKKTKLRYNEYYDMQRVYDSLYSASKNGNNFYKLLEIIGSEENIRLAYRNLKSNKGSNTKGTDGKTIDDIDGGLVNSVVVSVVESSGNPGKAILDNVAKPVILVPLRTVVFVILFFLALIILSIIIRATSVVNKLPVIGKLNSLLGGVLGLVQGLIIVFIVVIIAHMAVALSNNTLIFLNEMTINKSYAFSWVYNFSFLDFLN
mgnify:CR=1 FL=1